MADERNREKCGIFGVYSQCTEVANDILTGLSALQHRGQEASGLVTTDGANEFVHKGVGLVSRVYDGVDLSRFPGKFGIGHNRYSTSKASILQHTQPVVLLLPNNDFLALAHNGNLPQTRLLENDLAGFGVNLGDMNDSEMMAESLSRRMRKGATLEEALEDAYELFTGAFSLVLLTKNKLVATRDSFGIRPFSIGQSNKAIFLSSETCALDAVSAKFVRDIRPGELFVISENGCTSRQLVPGKQNLDTFEYVYFSRPDSDLLGRNVYNVRRRFGERLAWEYRRNLDADLVVPIPDSGIPAAIGFADYSGIPLEMAIIKNPDSHRTFIQPDQAARNNGVAKKLNVNGELVSGKRIIVVDDSIVRATTTPLVVEQLRRKGAKEVFVFSASPPVKFPDYYGVDTPDPTKLIASRLSVEQIRQRIGADRLHYLSFEGMIEAIGLDPEVLCTSCFTGEYPINIGEKMNLIHVPVAI